MTVRDLLKMEIDVDVYDSICDEIAIAFCGPVKLTEEGETHFSKVLDYPVEFNRDCSEVCVILDETEGVWQKQLRKAKDFFWSLAGYCAVDDYDRWFKI